VTHSMVNSLNAQQLTWKAELHPSMEQKTKDQIYTGLIPLTKDEMDATMIKLDTDGFVPPDAFDARDHAPDKLPCRAFNALDQGPCGSCYATAAASALSARMCMLTNHSRDVVLSVQEMIDCDRGCAGGHSYWTYAHIDGWDGKGIASVEDYCDPYKARGEPWKAAFYSASLPCFVPIVWCCGRLCLNPSLFRS
jgi:cathepsin B